MSLRLGKADLSMADHSGRRNSWRSLLHCRPLHQSPPLSSCCSLSLLGFVTFPSSSLLESPSSFQETMLQQGGKKTATRLQGVFLTCSEFCTSQCRTPLIQFSPRPMSGCRCASLSNQCPGRTRGTSPEPGNLGFNWAKTVRPVLKATHTQRLHAFHDVDFNYRTL